MNAKKNLFPSLKSVRLPELKALQKKMNARSEADLDMRIRLIGVPLTIDDYEIDDEIPIVHNRKVVLYIREPTNFQIYGTLPKYHIVHCPKIREMQDKGHYDRYHAITRTDGQFLVKLSNKDPAELRKLTLCKLCLNKLRSQYGWNVFPTDPKKFPLEDWLEPIFEYASEDWKKRSQDCRESANWTCQKCDINLESSRHYLHAHHKWNTRFNDPEDLMALCIGCHAEQPGDGHRMLKLYPEYQEFMREYDNEWKLLTEIPF